MHKVSEDASLSRAVFQKKHFLFRCEMCPTKAQILSSQLRSFPFSVTHRHWTRLSLVFKWISDTWNPISTWAWSVSRMTGVHGSVGDNCPTKNTARRPLIPHPHTRGLWPHWRQGARGHTHFFSQGCLQDSSARPRWERGGEQWPITPCTWQVDWNKEEPRQLRAFYCCPSRAHRSVIFFV